MKSEVKHLILEISIGIVLYNVVLALAALVIYPSMSVFLGFATGMVIALLMFIHMSLTFQKAAASADEQGAKRRTAIGVIFRSLVYLVVLVVILWKVPQINIIAVALGAMGLKAAAYAQPFIHGVMVREVIRKGE